MSVSKDLPSVRSQKGSSFISGLLAGGAGGLVLLLAANVTVMPIVLGTAEVGENTGLSCIGSLVALGLSYSALRWVGNAVEARGFSPPSGLGKVVGFFLGGLVGEAISTMIVAVLFFLSVSG